MKKCKVCRTEFKPRYSSVEMFCTPMCAHSYRKSKPQKKRKPIAKASKKRALQNREYSKNRKIFLAKPENQICFIDGCNKKANTIEHTKGRVGLLLLDETYWKPCCLKHNLELENNPELSKKYQLSKIHGGKKI